MAKDNKKSVKTDEKEPDVKLNANKENVQKINAESVRELMSKYKVDTMYENDRGEFFTRFDYAMLSVHSDKTKLKTHKK